MKVTNEPLSPLEVDGQGTFQQSVNEEQNNGQQNDVGKTDARDTPVQQSVENGNM